MTTISKRVGVGATSPNPVLVGRLVRQLRERNELSQERLAEFADLDHSAISRIESGKRQPTRETIDRIARAVGEDSSLLMIAAGYLPTPIAHQLEVGQRTPNEVRNALFRVLTLGK